jgi:hypothetical protein
VTKEQIEKLATEAMRIAIKAFRATDGGDVNRNGQSGAIGSVAAAIVAAALHHEIEAPAGWNDVAKALLKE